MNFTAMKPQQNQYISENIPEGYHRCDIPLVIGPTKSDGTILSVGGCASIRELERVFGLTRPSDLEEKKGLNEYQSKTAKAREIIQRSFKDKSRENNRDDYADYRYDYFTGKMYGAVPPITLYCSQPIYEHESGVYIPPLDECSVFAIDGETGLDAHYKCAELDKKFMNTPLFFTMHISLPAEAIRKIVYDLNMRGRPMKEEDLSSLNTTGPVTKAIWDGVEMAGAAENLVQRSGNGMGTPKNPKVATWKRLEHICAGAYFGLEKHTSRVESFLHNFRNEGSATSDLDVNLFSQCVAQWIKLPWETKKTSTVSECRILGALAKQKGVHVINPITIATIRNNSTKAKGIRKKDDRINIILSGLI